MKTIKMLFLLFTIAIFFGCDIKDPVEGIEVRLNTITRETLVTGYIFDASTGKPVEQNVTISFTGQNAQYLVDETNDPTSDFSVKGGFFNFAIKDGINISSDNQFKVVVNLSSDGYLDAEYPMVLNTKGLQGLTFFLAKKSDFSENIEVTSVPSGNANGSGTVLDSINVVSNEGTGVTISAGTTLTTTNGSPLQGNLTTQITTVVYDQGTNSLQPQNTGVGGNQAIAPLMSLNLTVTDNSGNTASNLTQPILTEIPLADNLVNPVTGNIVLPGDSIPVYHLNSDGNYERSYPSAYISAPGKRIKNNGSIKGAYSLHAYISYINSILGFSAPASTPKFVINNPRAGYTLQVFMGVANVFTPLAYWGQVNSNEITLLQDNFPNLAYSVRFKSGANPLNGEGGWLYAEIPWSTSNSGTQVPVTLNYPQESIQANIKITGVCTSRNPIVRAYPSITFNFRKQGTGTWLQGSLTNGDATIAGLEANTIYEAKTTYRDKEASVNIHVNSATDFTVAAGESQGSLLRAEVKGNTVENGITYVNLEIDIDLKNDCD